MHTQRNGLPTSAHTVRSHIHASVTCQINTYSYVTCQTASRHRSLGVAQVRDTASNVTCFRSFVSYQCANITGPSSSRAVQSGLQYTLTCSTLSTLKLTNKTYTSHDWLSIFVLKLACLLEHRAVLMWLPYTEKGALGK